MFMGHEETMSAMKDGVSVKNVLISFQTTIISLKYNGGILLGADGRSSNVSEAPD